MNVQRHFIIGQCPYYGLRLLKSPKAVAKPIVFCATYSCRAGGDLEEAMKNTKSLTRGFVSETEIDKMLGEMGVAPEETGYSK